jgi:ribosomal protein L33
LSLSFHINSGSFIGEKNIKHAARKMVLTKYDPIVNRYVLFTEQKLKK